jgi:hypothetical protein
MLRLRLFQSIVVNCLQGVITEASFKRMLNLVMEDHPWTDGHATQYLDMQTESPASPLDDASICRFCANRHYNIMFGVIHKDLAMRLHKFIHGLFAVA